MSEPVTGTNLLVKIPAGSIKTIGGNVVLLVGSLIIMVVALEGILATFIPKPIVWKDPQEAYVSDPVMGYKLVPLQTAYTHSFSVVTNSQGFRGREISLTPSPGTVRILCLGDSLTFGAGVAEGDTYPSQLESMLNIREPLRYEVINTGVPGYDTWQEAAFFRTYGIKFRPDLVIIGFYANDVVPKPKVVQEPVADAGGLQRQGLSRFVPDPIVYVLKRSRLLLLLRDRYVKLANQLMPSPEYLHQRAMIEGAVNDFNERGWTEVDNSLKEMSELRTAVKFDLLLVVFPMAEQLVHQYPNVQYQSKLNMLAGKYNIPMIDLKPSFERAFKNFGSLFIEGDGHPNANAYMIGASEIMKHIQQIVSKEHGMTYDLPAINQGH